MKKIIACFLSCFMMLVSNFIQAQENKLSVGHNSILDSLQNFLKTSKEDTNKVNTLIVLCKQSGQMGNYGQAMQYVKQAETIALNLNYRRGLAVSYNNIGIINGCQGDFEKALDNYSKSIKIYEETGDKKGISSSYGNIGLIYFFQGDYKKSLDNQLKSLSIREKIGDIKGMAYTYNNIGLIYEKQKNYEKALENDLKSLKIQQENGDKRGIGLSYLNIGSIYFLQGSFEKALNNFLKSLKINEEIGDKNGIARNYNNIGDVYEQQGNYDKALDNHLVSLKINEEIGDKHGIGLSYLNIGIAYIKYGKLEKSKNFLDQSLILFKEIGDKDGIKEAYTALSELYEKKGDYKLAFNYHKLYSEIKDTLLNEQSSKQIAEMSTKYDSEKKDKELIKKDAEINKQVAETEKQNLQRNAFIIGFFLVLVLAFFIFRSYRQKQNSNKLLEEKNILIEKQKQIVEEKNLKITDSINYAKRIQQAILPSHELIKSFLPETFIFFRPKDIVSGDFYWFSEKIDKLLLVVADCTGHGVPGAFMSMIGNTLLNEIINVKNICAPDQILNHLNKGIVSLLHQSSSDSDTQDDGMDITILSIDRINYEIEFAGANHFGYLLKDSQMKTLKGDVFSIGGMFGRADINFTTQKIKVETGSTIYLFTDGFIDQFGGEKNTKYLSLRFEKLLQNIQHQDMDKQKENLISAFDDWKGNNKQLDDILVVGIKI